VRRRLFDGAQLLARERVHRQHVVRRARPTLLTGDTCWSAALGMMTLLGWSHGARTLRSRLGDCVNKE
jgi:hypothetical protein